MNALKPGSASETHLNFTIYTFSVAVTVKVQNSSITDLHYCLLFYIEKPLPAITVPTVSCKVGAIILPAINVPVDIMGPGCDSSLSETLFLIMLQYMPYSSKELFVN